MTNHLDPEAQDVLDAMKATGLPPIHTLSVEDARSRMSAALMTTGSRLPLARVDDVAMPAPSGPRRIRLYRPVSGTLPIALFLHGGGWTVNDLDTHDELCRLLARQSGWLLASLDYRRAPEHRHPAALEDALLAFRWLLDNARQLDGDPACSAVVGESSGGTIAAGLALLLRDLNAPQPRCQVLAYPLTDKLGNWPSHTERGTGYTLDRDLLNWFAAQHLPASQDPLDPYLFPLTANDLSDLPPALVLTAEFDPLRDEGIAYAEKLISAGVQVEHLHAADQMHGFLMLTRFVRRAGALVEYIAGYLTECSRRASA